MGRALQQQFNTSDRHLFRSFAWADDLTYAPHRPSQVLLFVSLTKHDELPARKPFPSALEPDKRRGLKRTKSWRKMAAAAKQQQQMWFVGSKPKPPLFVGGRIQGVSTDHLYVAKPAGCLLTFRRWLVLLLWLSRRPAMDHSHKRLATQQAATRAPPTQ